MIRTAKTESGKVRGIPGADSHVSVFRGLPYAKPPVGELRWKAPRPADPWEGERLCAEYGPVPMMVTQPGTNPNDFYTKELNENAADYPMSEDCLYLNIFTPADTPDDALPVFCYIHGGGFTDGYNYECEFNGERLARRGVVVVMISYRLGLFGFLSHPDLRAEKGAGEPYANFGLYDQSFALHWVQRNIAAFGGDPERITVGGQSAGSGSAQIQAASPLNKGLLKGAIFQSSVSMPFADVPCFLDTIEDGSVTEQRGKAFMDRIGAGSISEARKLSAEELIGRLREAVKEERDLQHQTFTPCLDGMILPQDYAGMYYRDMLPDMPVMTGHCMKETHRFLGRGTNAADRDGFMKLLEDYGEDRDAMEAACTVKNDADAEALFDHGAFNRMLAGSRAYCRLRAEKGRPTWYFRFDHDLPGDDAGSFHGSELWFMFDSLANCWRPFEGKHYDLARKVSSYWLNFIRTGDPNGTDYNGVPLPEWKACTEKEEGYMLFRDEPVMTGLPEDEILRLRIKHSEKMYKMV